MASWNPSPFINGANWSGNSQLATKNQLLSTSAGFYEDLKDFNFSTISVSTLNVPNWISTSKLYVSDIVGANIDISGIIFDASGLLYAPTVSSTQGIFNITNVSVMQMTFKPTFTGNIEVTFDLGLGHAIGGLLAGLGAAVGGGLIAVGTGAGLAIQGAEQGIATIIAGRPQNFINNTTYETINFTSQLQVSTLGNAYPLYSSIFRTVSSSAANVVPGREIFTSSFFTPGQICIRSVSDPFNLVTGDTQINSSTIQSFGEWIPLEGLEPTNIVADSISTLNLSTGNLFASLTEVDDIIGYSGQFSNIGVSQTASLAYQAPLTFQTGATNQAAFEGYLNRLYCYNNTGYIFSGAGGTTQSASLYLGQNPNESLLTVSSIFSQGNIQANTGFISSLTVNNLTVLSSFSTVYNVTTLNILSTGIVETDVLNAQYASISSLAPFQFFSTQIGNPYGTFDITKTVSFVSTNYNAVSSLTNNILNYTLVEEVSDQTSFNLNIAETQFGVNYILSPANEAQWNSTLMIFNDYQNGGSVTLPVAQTFINSNLTGTFDIQTQYNPATPGYYAPFSVVQTWIPGSEYSTFSTFLQLSGPDPPSPPPLGTWRFTIGNTGWIQSVETNPAPYETTNSNIFTITQDINDLTIATTDRLNLQAGEIFFKGQVNLNTTNVGNAYAINTFASNGYISDLNASYISTGNLVVNPLGGGINTLYYKSSIGWNQPPQSVTPLELIFKNDSPDYLPQFNLLAPFQGVNYFTSYNVSSWNNSIQINAISVASGLGPPKVFLGDLQAPLGGAYSGFFYINNSVAQAMTIYSITSAGSNAVGVCAGLTYMKIQTADGVNWTLTSNVANPAGLGGSFSNNLTITQGYQNTNITNTQNLDFQAPNITYTAGNFSMYADQIRVNSHKYGFAEATGLPSYPIGIENNVYQDNNMVFSYNTGPGNWQSDATNVLYNVTGQIYYDYNSWIVQVIPSRFRVDQNIQSWDVQPAVFPVGGSGGYCWGYNRYILVQNNPGSGTNNWNWYMAIPRNYCTYVS